MSSNGRPDYDAGDLVVCVHSTRPNSPNLGKVFSVERLVPPDAFDPRWGVHVLGLDAKNDAGWAADCFRRIDPKPPEFWTGTVDADAGEQVPA